MRQILLLFTLLVSSNYVFSQVTKKDINKYFREEAKPVVDYYIDNYIDPFLFSLNSNQYKNIELVKKTTNVLVKHDVKQIQLTGHCSDAELKTYPTVSLERAHKIKSLMKCFGYDPYRIEIKDVKNTQPVEWTGNNEENQRVEIIILKA
jgi:hypothetical protein